MNVLFRVNAGAEKGLGHLTRCIALANAFEKLGAACHFVMDRRDDSISPFLNTRNVYVLTSPTPQDQIADALETGQIASQTKCRFIVMDDYDLDQNWETTIRQQGFTLLVIDDILRSHNCDFLIDYRWRGENGKHAYDELTDKDCIKLLGPAYVLLPENYTSRLTTKHTDNKANINITVGFGGAGNFDLAAPLIDNLLKKLDHDIQFRVILGPLFAGMKELQKTCAQYNNVQFIIGQTDLFETLSQTDLYIGPAGTIMYQLCALGIPALTFSTAPNQDNDHQNLEDIGHYFHINRFGPEQAAKLAHCVNTFIRQYNRVKALTEHAVYPIDGWGAKRVAQFVMGMEVVPYMSNPAQKNLPSLPIKSDFHTVRHVTDCDINHYLDARNLPANRENMTFCTEINRLDHYHWWFQNKRASYLLSYNDEARLYIWHSSFTENEQDYLIGGWFVCSENAQFQDSLIALAWQLEYCSQAYPDAVWLAVINRDNKSVKKLNDYMGFIEMDESHPYFPITQNAFPQASYDTFHYVFLPSELKARTL